MRDLKEKQINFSELADWIISRTLKAGADDCKVNISKGRLVEINYRDHKPDVIKEAGTQGLSLSVYANKRFSTRQTPDFRKSTLEGFIAEAVETIKIMEEDPFRTLPDPKYYEGRSDTDLQLDDPVYAQLTPEERHDMAKTVEESCLRNAGKKVISVEAVEYDDSYEEYIKTSNGFEGSSRRTSFTAGALVTIQDEGDRRPEGYNYISCRYKSDLPPLEKIGEVAATRTLNLLGSKKIPTVKLPVIIENRGVSRVLNDIFEPMSGSSIQQKRSFLADKKDQQIGSKLFTIIDDPFIPRAMGSRLYDDDGFPSRKRELISEGVLKEFLVSWYYSRKLGWEPTTASTSNIIIPPGKRSVDEIIKDLNKCILITGFIGGNSNSATGDFSVGIMGRLYEKGEFVRNISEMNIADNYLNFWHKLIEVANDPWIYSQLRSPSLVIDNVVVSGT
jgi:PmbA protein